jgi:hypothetical protein
MVNTGMASPKNCRLYNYEINLKVLKIIMDLGLKTVMGYLNIYGGGFTIHLSLVIFPYI